MARIAGPANIHGLTRSSQRPFSDSASLLRIQKMMMAPPIPPITAITALTTLMAIALPLSVGRMRCRLRGRPVGHPRSQAASAAGLGEAVVDVVERRVEVLLTREPLDRLGPEGAGADLCGHGVGAVEASCRRLVEDVRGDLLQRLVRQQRHVGRLVRRERTVLGLLGAVLLAGDEVAQLDRAGVVVEGG